MMDDGLDCLRPHDNQYQSEISIVTASELYRHQAEVTVGQDLTKYVRA